MKITVIDGIGGSGRDDDFTEASVEDGKWFAKVRVYNSWLSRPEDKRQPWTERPMPLYHSQYAHILGVQQEEVIFLPYWDARDVIKGNYSCVNQEWWVIADKPFVVVYFNDDPNQSEYRLWRGFRTARQVHKGEKGQNPPLHQRKPKVARSEIPHPMNCPARKLPDLNWVQLEELSRIIGMEPLEIVEGFAGFSPSTYYEPNVPLILMDERHSKMDPVRPQGLRRVYTTRIPDDFCCGEESWRGVPITLQEFREIKISRVWVPQRWALNVLRLTQFGYRPDCELPQPGFKLEADTPIQPEAELPDLPVEELKELRLYRESELSREEFVGMVEQIMGSAGRQSWRERKVMSDPLDGFAHYTDFEIQEFNDGEQMLVIGVCFWTRAGASRSPNHWAGQISIHPPPGFLFDPRRDEAILKIWLWPDELVRQVPEGSVGGICPDNIGIKEKSVAWLRHIIEQLGYTLEKKPRVS